MLGIYVFFAHLCVLCMGSVKIGYDFYPELKGYLKVHEEPTDWRTARINCHNEVALLASPWSPEFATTISRLLTTKYPSLPVLYSGAGIRAASTGVPMEVCANKRCRVFRADGTMDKVNCNQKLPYACFAPKVSSCGDGYELNSQTGHCYKFHAASVGASVPDAKTICSREGGYLAKISDDTEKTVLTAMSDGLTFIDNDNGGIEYRHLSTSGYTDYQCNGTHAFICEIASDLRD